jgi:hypothetical protein
MQLSVEMNLDWARILGFEILRYTTLVYTKTMHIWRRLVDWWTTMPDVRPYRRYYMSSSRGIHESDLRVPTGCVYVEEWRDQGDKKYVVRYADDIIPNAWVRTPFEQTARCPWIWVGDRTTEIDLTRTFNRFLVPGNRIRMELVEQLVHINERTDLLYIESGTFKELKFPGEGLLIKANGDE